MKVYPFPWTSESFAGGNAWTLDTSGTAGVARRPDGASASSGVQGGARGTNNGPGPGAVGFTLPDAWSSAGVQYPSFFYAPGASDLKVTFRGVSIAVEGYP